jgi:hypothetical protein
MGAAVTSLVGLDAQRGGSQWWVLECPGGGCKLMLGSEAISSVGQSQVPNSGVIITLESRATIGRPVFGTFTGGNTS